MSSTKSGLIRRLIEELRATLTKTTKGETKMEKRTMTVLGAAILGVMAVAVLLWAAGNVGASPPMGPLAQGEAPLYLNYQGRLTDPATGLPKPDGTYNITFKIYDAEIDGGIIWSEVQVVTVSRGLFNVLLGSSTALSASDFDGTARWLELEVEGEILSPLVRLVSAPFAIQAEEAKNADTVDGSHASAFASATHDHDANYVNEGQANSVTGGMIVDGTIQQADLPFGVPDGHSLDAADGSPTDAVYVDNDGNVGIGTAPGEQLTVAGRIESTSGGFKFPDGTTQTTAAAGAGNVKQLIQDFVVAAGESITAGDVVGFLDGYVYEGFPPGNDISYASGYVFNSADTGGISIAALSSTKFVVAYRDGIWPYSGTAVIGSVSGSTITFGSGYVFNSAETSSFAVAALSSTKFVVAYRDEDNSDYGTAVIGDVSGSTITFVPDPENVFNSAYTGSISIAALSPTQFVVAYSVAVHPDYYGAAVIGSVSGSTITYGPEYVFNSGSTSYFSAAALSSTQFVVAYRDPDNSDHGTAVIGDVSGRDITYGAEHVFNSADSGFISAAALSPTQFVVAYMDSNHGTAVIGDVFGRDITYGSEYVFDSADTSHISAAALSPTQFVVTYCDIDSVFKGTAVVGDVSGRDITYGSEYVFNSAPTFSTSPAAALSSTKFVVAYRDPDNSDHGTAIIGDAFDGHVVGIASESKTAGQTVPVIIGGVSDVHSDLTSGEIYYGDAWGDLTTDVTDYYRVGLAISSTEILLYSDRDNVDQFFGDMIFKNNFRITEADSYEGLILKNQLNREILTISDEGDLAASGRLRISSLMRLSPTDSPGTCNAGWEGSIYYDGSLNEPCFCDGSNWRQFDGGGTCEPFQK